MKIWSAIRKALGKLTDLLTAGRQAGLWSEKPQVPAGPKVPPPGVGRP